MSVNSSISNSEGRVMKQRQFSRYLKCFALCTLCSLLFIVGFNWLVNPYYIFNSPSIEGFNALKPYFGSHLQMAKAISVRKIKPSAICLGTSRAVVGIDPSHPGWSYTPVYNLGIIGANIYEMTRYLQHANALQPLKQVVVMLDFLSFNIYRENRSDFDEARLAVRYDGQKNPLFMVNNEIVASLVSVDTLFESIKTINHQVENGFEYLENGMRIGLLPSMKGGHHAYFLRTAESYITDSYLPNPYRQFQFTNPKTGRSSFDYYRKIVQIAYQDDIDLHIAISPSHVLQWENLAVIGLWPKFEKWKRALVEINEEEALHAGKSPFPLWDFSVYNKFTIEAVPPLGDTETKMQWYWDSSHYKKELGNLMLNRIFNYQEGEGASYSNFGVLLTSENINEHIRKIRTDRQNYHNTHADDITEIEELALKLGVMSKD